MLFCDMCQTDGKESEDSIFSAVFLTKKVFPDWLQFYQNILFNFKRIMFLSVLEHGN